MNFNPRLIRRSHSAKRMTRSANKEPIDHFHGSRAASGYGALVNRLRDRRGVTIVFVTLMLLVLLGFAGLAVDVGYVMVTRNELQNVSDAASLAATRFIGLKYEELGTWEAQKSYTFTQSEIVIRAQQTALSNAAGGKSVAVNDADVFIGKWDGKTRTLYDIGNMNQPDAVRVIARRDGLANGPVATFFAKVLGRDTVDVSAKATAALTGSSTIGEGGLPLPVGISEARFNTEYCDKPIRFYPSNDPLSCGGWHTYTGDPYDPNAADLRALLIALRNGTYASPATEGGDIFTFTGGTLASAFAEMKALFDTMRVKNDGVLDNDKDSSTWTTAVAVYDSNNCSNPNRGDTLKIVGFSEITITAVLESPDKIIDGVIKCDYVEAGRGGGASTGTKGSIPGLVQ